MSPSSNDREWFEQAVVAALPDLFGTAVRLARNRTEAEDIVAETVARGWANLDTRAAKVFAQQFELVPARTCSTFGSRTTQGRSHPSMDH